MSLIDYQTDYWYYRKFLAATDTEPHQQLIDWFNSQVFPGLYVPIPEDLQDDEEEDELTGAIAAFNLGVGIDADNNTSHPPLVTYMSASTTLDVLPNPSTMVPASFVAEPTPRENKSPSTPTTNLANGNDADVNKEPASSPPKVTKTVVDVSISEGGGNEGTVRKSSRSGGRSAAEPVPKKKSRARKSATIVVDDTD